MPSIYYKRNFIQNYYYHIYNRGANKNNIFYDTEDYNTFLEILSYYLESPNGIPLSLKGLIKVPNLKYENNVVKSSFNLSVYCLMPNHFHLLIKQVTKPNNKNSVTNFMRRLAITYAMYTKNKYDRSGTLFEGKYKNVLVNKDSQLIHLSKYIHTNPLEILGSEPLINYKYSSYPFYIRKKKKPNWLYTSEILSFFSQNKPHTSYQSFAEDEPIATERIERVILD